MFTKIISIVFGLIEMWRQAMAFFKKVEDKRAIEDAIRSKEEVKQRTEAAEQIKNSQSEEELWDAQEKLVRARNPKP